MSVCDPPEMRNSQHCFDAGNSQSTETVTGRDSSSYWSTTHTLYGPGGRPAAGSAASQHNAVFLVVTILAIIAVIVAVWMILTKRRRRSLDVQRSLLQHSSSEWWHFNVGHEKGHVVPYRLGQLPSLGRISMPR